MHVFKERVALVTGSTGEGMGRSIAFTLARQSAKVVLNYGTGHPNNAHAADKVLAELRSLGGKGYIFKADTREEDEVQAMVDGVMTLYGRIDFLICNHGGDYTMNDITEIDREQWRSVIKAEIDGLFFCIKHALPHMRREHFGRIIAIGRPAAEVLSGPPFDYNLGKAGRSAFIKALAYHELANGITCNIVAPAQTPHVTLRQAVEAAKHSSGWKRRSSVQPQDVAEVVRFLCSDEAAFVTGNVIEVGGRFSEETTRKRHA